MKRILIISAFTPSNSSAGQNYTLQLINDLASNLKIDLIYFEKPHDAPYVPTSPNIKVLRVLTDNLMHKLSNTIKMPLLHPFFTNRFSYRLAKQIAGISTQYDYIYFDFSQTFLYALFVKHKRKFLMSHDVISQIYARRKSYFKYLSQFFVTLSENIILRLACGQILCFSQKDCDILRRYDINDAISVHFYLNKMIDSVNLSKEQIINNQFCFYGVWSRPENSKGLEWFFDNVYSNLDQNQKFLIIGPGLREDIKNALSKYANVEITGFINNPYKIISQSAGMIVPLFEGAGVKVKVVESLACGTTVLGTEIAFEGIEPAISEHMVLCNCVEDFVTGIKRRSPTTADKITLHSYFRKHYPHNTFKKLIKEESI